MPKGHGIAFPPGQGAKRFFNTIQKIRKSPYFSQFITETTENISLCVLCVINVSNLSNYKLFQCTFRTPDVSDITLILLSLHVGCG